MSANMLGDKRVFTKAMADKSGFYADYNAKSGALGIFVSKHAYPLSETDRKTLQELSSACQASYDKTNRSLWALSQSELDLYRPEKDREGNINSSFNASMSPSEKDSKFYSLIEKQNEQTEALMQRQAELDLKVSRLMPEPVEPMIEQANAASVALKQKLGVDMPDFRGLERGHQNEYDFHTEYRDATDAHSTLYIRLQSNIALGREKDNTTEMKGAAENLQQLISDYEKKYLGQEQFYKTDEEKRENGATFTNRAYDADSAYAWQKGREDRVLSGDMFIRDDEIVKLREKASSFDSYPVKLAVERGNSIGLPLQDMIAQSTQTAAYYKGVKPATKPPRPTPAQLQHNLNTLIVLLMVTNINADRENDPLRNLFMTMLSKELLQSARETKGSQVLTQPGPFPSINSFVEQLGNNLGTKENATKLMDLINIDVIKNSFKPCNPT